MGLNEDYIIPPFSYFDTRQGYWQERKNKWLSLGIKSEVGRKKKLLGGSAMDGTWSTRVIGKHSQLYANSAGTSVFDATLCEVIYSWFGFKGCSVLDPFAGGSVRGIIADKLGLHYTGIELRPEQVKSNIEQAKKIGVNPTWIIGDSNEKLKDLEYGFDLLFTCPPYYNLEIYSDLEGELSNIDSYIRFLKYYNEILSKAISKISSNRFLCTVVQNIRDSKGYLTNLVGDTVSIFENNRCNLYNDIVLINQPGSLPIRIGGQFPTRKMGKCHQNVLVFWKGDDDPNEYIKSNYPEMPKIYNIDNIKLNKNLFGGMV